MLRADVMELANENACGGASLVRDTLPEGIARSADVRTESMDMNVLLRRPLGGIPLPPPARPSAFGPAGAEPGRVRADELAQHMPRLRSVIRRILNNELDAEDVLQDVMVSALQKLGTFRGDAQLGTWLHRIAVNAALLYRRRRATASKSEETRVDDATLGVHGPTAPARVKTLPPDVETIKQEGARLIQAAIAKLPPLYREVYLLADVDDQPNEQIAQDLKLKLAAVKSRLHRARKMMRDQLAGHFQPDAAKGR